MMADNSVGKGIPSWQLPSSSQNAETGNETGVSSPPPEQQQQPRALESQNSSDKQPSESMVEQAKRFLTDDSLKTASLEQKIAFLRSKGLRDSDIDQAILETKPYTTIATASSTESSQLPSTKANTTSKSDVPPIITYPEFLMQAQKPPPLITVSRLLNTAYAAAGIGAVVYGLSRYLVAPMADSLTSARHDFASHAQSRIDELNDKLSEIVSTQVNLDSSAHHNFRSKTSASAAAADDVASDADSSNSDPTELFHRDYGTQTSPIETKISSSSSSSSSSASDASADASSNALADQTSTLSKISTHLTDLVNEDAAAGSANSEISQVIKVLEDYLDSIAYPAYSSNNNAYGYGYGLESNKPKKEEDEINRMKAEIRSVKGVLLSARNFPGSTTARRPLYSPTANSS